MKIQNNKSLASLKEEFNEVYPGLKLEFFNTVHGEFEGSVGDNIVDNNLTIKELGSKLSEGEISIEGKRTVRDLELDFEVNYGLHVQVYRLSNDLWLQTIKTDDWTLEDQNRKGLLTLKN